MDMGDIAGNPIAQLAFLILSAAGGYQVWRKQQPTDAKERADSEGQIAALGTWKELLEGERAARLKAEERADKFAAERNEALKELWEMKGQLRAMNETLAAQTAELASLRDQVRQLKEQLHAQ
jgi:predicted  nucleic acid-binding Zn-ribbon protein